MNPFDHYVKATLGLKYYGCYVDDFVIVHESKEYLRGLIPKLADYLRSDLGLVLHPRKVYLQHYSHGVKYLGLVGYELQRCDSFCSEASVLSNGLHVIV